MQVTEVGRTLQSVFSEMVLVHGFVHGDPHAGNVLARCIPGAPAPHLVEEFGPSLRGFKIVVVSISKLELEEHCVFKRMAFDGWLVEGEDSERRGVVGAGTRMPQIVILDHGLYHTLDDQRKARVCGVKALG